MMRLVAALRRLFSKAGRGGRSSSRTRLLNICFGDEARAQRLIAGECKKAPGISEEEATRRAIARYQADNR